MLKTTVLKTRLVKVSKIPTYKCKKCRKRCAYTIILEELARDQSRSHYKLTRAEYYCEEHLPAVAKELWNITSPEFKPIS